MNSFIPLNDQIFQTYERLAFMENADKNGLLKTNKPNADLKLYFWLQDGQILTFVWWLHENLYENLCTQLYQHHFHCTLWYILKFRLNMISTIPNESHKSFTNIFIKKVETFAKI